MRKDAERLRTARTGAKNSPESIAKMLATKKAKYENGNYAPKDDTRLSPAHCEALSKARIGKTHSAATKKKIADSVRKQNERNAE